MCGRFAVAKSHEQLTKRFGVVNIDPNYRLSFNISPRQKTPVILNEAPDEIQMVQWGLVPRWAKDDEKYFINARAETLREKPAFKSIVRSRRCLVIADSFFEWQKQGKGKIPHRIYLPDDELFAFAGIWDTWQDRTTYAIITTEPNELVEKIHDRMPVILPREYERSWLKDGDVSLLKPFAAAGMRAYTISTLVNSPANNSEALLKPLGKEI